MKAKERTFPRCHIILCYLFCSCVIVIATFPAAAAPGNVLKGGGFEGFAMSPVDPSEQPEKKWKPSYNSMTQIIRITSCDIDDDGLLVPSSAFRVSVGD